MFSLNECSRQMKVLDKEVFSLNARSLNINTWSKIFCILCLKTHSLMLIRSCIFLYYVMLLLSRNIGFFCTFKQQPRVTSHDGYLSLLFFSINQMFLFLLLLNNCIFISFTNNNIIILSETANLFIFISIQCIIL